MSRLEWTLWEHVAPLAAWLHDGALTLAQPLVVLLLLAASVALLGALVGLVRRGASPRAIADLAPGRNVLPGDPAPPPARRPGIARGGRGARAPSRPDRRPLGILLAH
ncbi:MAG: hypothetical protein J7480_03675 [Microbacteriaceae bacterium]|nr:hypothetical protein [Microbacteriaceae bacterium]